MPAKKPSPPPKRHHQQVGDKPQWELFIDWLRKHPDKPYTNEEIAKGVGTTAQRLSATISTYRHRLPIRSIEPTNGTRAMLYQYDPSKPHGLAPTETAKKETLPALIDHRNGTATKNGHQINGVQRRKAHLTPELFARVLYNGTDFCLLETQTGDIIQGKVLR